MAWRWHSSAILSKKQFKQAQKERKAHDKQREKAERRRVFVLNFHGDIRGTAVASLREEVTAVLTVAQAEDEIVLRLESAGGWCMPTGWRRRNCCASATGE
ncbi:MAG: hypothetical protein R3F44_10230 [Candidatus Competibacteraceae bacterium]